MTMNDFSERLERDWAKAMHRLEQYEGAWIRTELKELYSGKLPVGPGAEPAHTLYFELSLPFTEVQRITLGSVRPTVLAEDSQGKPTLIAPFPEHIQDQISHQVGLRLERLAEMFEVRAVSPLLRLRGEWVTPELVARLKRETLPNQLDNILGNYVPRTARNMQQFSSELRSAEENGLYQ